MLLKRQLLSIHIFYNNTNGVIEQVREIKSGESYSSQSSYTMSIGTRLVESIDSLKIIWPSGLVQYHYNIAPNQTHYIIEGEDSDASSCLFPIESQNLVDGLDCAGKGLEPSQQILHSYLL